VLRERLAKGCGVGKYWTPVVPLNDQAFPKWLSPVRYPEDDKLIAIRPLERSTDRNLRRSNFYLSMLRCMSPKLAHRFDRHGQHNRFGPKTVICVATLLTPSVQGPTASNADRLQHFGPPDRSNANRLPSASMAMPHSAHLPGPDERTLGCIGQM
jgi:hypothetical protein